MRLIYSALFAVSLIFGFYFKPLLWASSPHMDSLACATCHLAGGEVTVENAHILHGSQESLCKACHDKEMWLSHPSGFAVARDFPEGFPKDWKGDLTCSTCHRVHGSQSSLLRVQMSKEDFCKSCHNEDFFSKMRDGGESIANYGHVPSDDLLAVIEGFDPFTQGCLECHNEEAPLLPLSVSGAGLLLHEGSRLIHPIGRSYESAQGYGGYRSLQDLPVSINLPNGEVACISCHKAYSKDHGGLTVTLAGSALCLACHDL